MIYSYIYHNCSSLFAVTLLETVLVMKVETVNGVPLSSFNSLPCKQHYLEDFCCKCRLLTLRRWLGPLNMV